MKTPHPSIASVTAGLLTLVWTSACVTHQAPVAEPAPPPPGETLIVLLEDADTGAVGRAHVSGLDGFVELATANEGILVATGQTSRPVDGLSDAEVTRIFGDALKALPPPPIRFTLNFEFNSDQLTDESRALIPRIMEAMKERPVPDIVVVGHTDTVGSAEINAELGLKRAVLIQKLLVAASIDPASIATFSSGERDPLIQTPDDTREPRNRRVEISVR